MHTSGPDQRIAKARTSASLRAIPPRVDGRAAGVVVRSEAGTSRVKIFRVRSQRSRSPTFASTVTSPQTWPALPHWITKSAPPSSWQSQQVDRMHRCTTSPSPLQWHETKPPSRPHQNLHAAICPFCAFRCQKSCPRRRTRCVSVVELSRIENRDCRVESHEPAAGAIPA